MDTSSASGGSLVTNTVLDRNRYLNLRALPEEALSVEPEPEPEPEPETEPEPEPGPESLENRGGQNMERVAVLLAMVMRTASPHSQV
jgi:hypothetical protein